MLDEPSRGRDEPQIGATFALRKPAPNEHSADVHGAQRLFLPSVAVAGGVLAI